MPCVWWFVTGPVANRVCVILTSKNRQESIYMLNEREQTRKQERIFYEDEFENFEPTYDLDSPAPAPKGTKVVVGELGERFGE